MPTCSPVDHHRGKGPAAVDNSPEVDVHDALELALLGVGERSREPDSGVVDDDVRYAVMCRDRLREPNHGLFVGHVHLIGVGTATEHCFGAARLRRDVYKCRSVLRAFEIDVGDHDDSSLGGEGEGRFTPDAAARTGDHHQRAGEIAQSTLQLRSASPAGDVLE